MFLVRIWLLLLALCGLASAQSNPGFIDGKPLCANYPNGNCPAPANPLSLNQAFMAKQDVGTLVGFYTPQQFGTITNSFSTDTPAIDAAFSAAIAARACVYFPAGNYSYNGTGWNSTRPNSFPNFGDGACIVGGGIPFTNITLGAGTYLIDNVSFTWASLYVFGIHTIGGAGVIRDRNTGVDTLSHKIIDNNYFQDYTGAAISTNSSDSPFWTVSNNEFHGVNMTSTIGYANCSLGGSVVFFRNDFQVDAVHIKLGQGGNNDLVGNDNQFYRDVGSGTVTAVWVVPQPNTGGAPTPNSGTGFAITNTKFGNENLQAGDYAVLYADEGAGVLCGGRMPSFAASTGFITGHQFNNIAIYGTGGSFRPLVYSTTPHISSSAYTNIHVDGNTINYVLQYASPPVTNSPLIGGNVIGPVYFNPGLLDSSLYQSYEPTNGVGVAVVVDPNNVQDLTNHNLPNSIPSTANSGDYTNLLTTGVTGFTLANANVMCTAQSAVGSCTGSGAADATGGGDQANYTVTNTNWGVSQDLSVTPVVGLPIWIEFDLGPGSGTPLGAILLTIYEDVGFTIAQQTPFAVPAARRRIRLRFDPDQNATGGFHSFRLFFLPATGASPGTGTFSLGRVAVYQARQPAGGNVWKGITFCEDSLSIPATNPVGGGYLYCQGGALKFRGSSGTVTTVAPP